MLMSELRLCEVEDWTVGVFQQVLRRLERQGYIREMFFYVLPW